MANKYNSMIAKIQQSGREVVENDLIKDTDWIESAKKIYKMDNGKDFKGSPQEAVQYGLDRMSAFNYNISGSHIPGQGKHGGTVPDAINIHKQDDDTKIAFAYLMDTYDDKDVSWEGVKRFATETATDLTNYIGFGAGLGAKFAVRNTAKTALRKQLIDGISKMLSTQAGVMTSAATLGAGYAGGSNVAEQEVKTQAGLQKKIEPKEAMVHTAIGAVAGPTIVKGVQVAGKGIGKGIDYVRKQGEEAMAQAAGGGTPPSSEYTKFKQDMSNLEAKHGDINNLDYDMMDISDRERTRLQRVNFTIRELINQPDDAKETVPSLKEVLAHKTYKDELLKYSDAKPSINYEKGTVKIYRSALGDIEPGDWIGLNKQYASGHGRTKAHKVFAKEVPIEDIRWQGADFNEWIYLPQDIVNKETK